MMMARGRRMTQWFRQHGQTSTHARPRRRRRPRCRGYGAADEEEEAGLRARGGARGDQVVEVVQGSQMLAGRVGAVIGLTGRRR